MCPSRKVFDVWIFLLGVPFVAPLSVVTADELRGPSSLPAHARPGSDRTAAELPVYRGGQLLGPSAGQVPTARVS